MKFGVKALPAYKVVGREGCNSGVIQGLFHPQMFSNAQGIAFEVFSFLLQQLLSNECFNTFAEAAGSMEMGFLVFHLELIVSDDTGVLPKLYIGHEYLWGSTSMAAFSTNSDGPKSAPARHGFY